MALLPERMVALLVSAWIETLNSPLCEPIMSVALLVSAWIETLINESQYGINSVALLVSAWIETIGMQQVLNYETSHSS